MPLAQISILEGRDEEQKKTLISEVTRAICDSLDAPQQSVRVVLTEVPSSHWGIGGKTAKELGR